VCTSSRFWTATLRAALAESSSIRCQWIRRVRHDLGAVVGQNNHVEHDGLSRGVELKVRHDFCDQRIRLKGGLDRNEHHVPHGYAYSARKGANLAVASICRTGARGLKA